jgi:hypothetical protein
MNTTRFGGGSALAALLAVAFLAFAAPAQAGMAIDEFSVGFHEPGTSSAFPGPYEVGAPVTQAGAHADLVTRFKFGTVVGEFGPTLAEQVKDADFDLPAGFYGNPEALPRCTPGDLAEGQGVCSPNSQVGVAEVQIGADPAAVFPAPVYNLTTAKDETAVVGFLFVGSPVKIEIGARPEDGYRLRASIRNTNQYLGIYGTKLILWGTPADPIHDAWRWFDQSQPPGSPSGALRRPFITMPTTCDEPLMARMLARSWQTPDEWTTAGDELPAQTGCELLRFEPSIAMAPTSPLPDSPAGYRFELDVPQDQNAEGLGTPQLRRASVTLPEGVTLSPSAAHGLAGCSDAQIGLGSLAEPTCPRASIVGKVSVDTPVLDEPLTGEVFVGTQQPADPYRLFLVLRGPGLVVKLPGSITADPITGRLTATFDQTPQLPFSKLTIDLEGGPHAPLANPATCGTKTTVAELTPWSGQPPVTTSSSFEIACTDGGFAPSFTAGTTVPIAGQFSPFALRIERPDRQGILAGVSVDLPDGLLARLKGVPLCSDRDANAGSCPAATRVGKATVGAGPGSDPFFLSGSVSLTGPYKGAPYGLAVSVRAIAGPYDLGTVVVRQALHVDRGDAHVKVVSDPLPTILEGIPLRLRTVQVDIDRPKFALNPTSCAAKRVDGVLSSVQGVESDVGTRFQVGGCRALGFAPKLGLRLTGDRQLAPGRHPGLRAFMRQPAGQANPKRVRVKLPRSLALDAANAAAVCGYEESLKADCPKASRIGTASVRTPILSKPLSGPVYLVQGIRIDRRTGNRIRTLPTLLAKLRGQVAIDLRAKNSVAGGNLVTTFGAVPDAPVSTFRLKLAGGANGILAVTGERNLCRSAQGADVAMRGHNGRGVSTIVRMKSPCR